MMPRILLSLFLALLLLPGMTTAARAAIDTGSVEGLLVQSGIHEQIRQFPDAMTFKIGQIYELGQCDEKSFNAIKRGITQTINRAAMQKIVLEDVTNGISPDDFQRLQQWYGSPAGKRLTQMEMAASTTTAYDKIRKEGDMLFANSRKLALVKKIDATLHATDWAVNVELQSTIAMLGGLAQIQHKDITANLVQFALQLDEQKALLRPQVEKSVLLWYMFAYKDASYKELEEYLTFLQQDSTQRFNSLALKSLSHAITVVVEDFILNIEEQSQASHPSL